MEGGRGGRADLAGALFDFSGAKFRYPWRPELWRFSTRVHAGHLYRVAHRPRRQRLFAPDLEGERLTGFLSSFDHQRGPRVSEREGQAGWAHEAAQSG